MKLAFITALVLACGGCAKYPPKREPVADGAKQELEIWLLQAEIGVAVSNLYALQKQLSGASGYPPIPGALPYSTASRESDLNRAIDILREARGRLVDEHERISRQQRVPKSEY